MLAHWDPFSELQRFQDQVFGTDRAGGQRVAFRPAVDIFEEDDAIVVQVEIPGVKADDLHVNVEKNVLTVRGERKFERDEENGGVHRIERVYGTFSRSFALPDTVDSDAIDADYKDGLLSLRLPKKPAEQPKRISVKATS